MNIERTCSAEDPIEGRFCILHRGHDRSHMAGDGTRWSGPTREQLKARRAKLRQLAFEIVHKPINPSTEHDRRTIILAEPPRWDPDNALARYVGDVDVFDYPDALDGIGGAS